VIRLGQCNILSEKSEGAVALSPSIHLADLHGHLRQFVSVGIDFNGAELLHAQHAGKRTESHAPEKITNGGFYRFGNSQQSLDGNGLPPRSISPRYFGFKSTISANRSWVWVWFKV
jgi:hypothetical protein